MKTIEEIRSHLINGQFEFSHHGFRRSIERNISESEIRETGKDAMIIEDYSDDKYSPSCLLLGFTIAGRPLHIQVTRIETSPSLIKIVTIYQPDEDEWIDYSIRR